MKVFVQSPSGKEKVVTSEVGKTVKIKAINGAKYQFVDEVPSPVAKKVNAKKVGKNLEIFIDEDEIADIVIENYYSEAKAVPEILNESSMLEAEAGTITLDSTPNALFLTPFEPSLYTLAAIGGAAGVGVVAASSGGSSGGSSDEPATASSVEIVNKDGFTSGTASAKITLGSSVRAGDVITIVLKATNNTPNDATDDTTLATYTHTVTNSDLTTGYYSQTLAQETASDVYTVETTIGSTALETKHLTVSIDGVLSDDYIAYSTVFIDTDNDGTLDWTDANNDSQWQEGEGEAWTTTDSSGHFSFTIDANGAPIVALGGVDTASGNPNNIVYKMFSNATSSVDGADIVISPLSTIIASIIEKNAATNGTTGQEVTQDEILSAVSSVANAFGLTSMDPASFLTYDVVKAIQNNDTSNFNNELLTLNRQVAVVLSTTSALIDGAVSTTNSTISSATSFGTGTKAASSAFADLILSKEAAGTMVDMSSSSDINYIITDAMTTANENTSSTTTKITATNTADITTISDLISSFNGQVATLTTANGANDSTVINTLRAVTDAIVPALSQAGAEAATDRGGDISLSSAISALNTALDTAGTVSDYITNQVAIVEAKTEQFLANDVSGTAGQLSKIVLQMPSLGVGDTIDTLTIRATLYSDTNVNNEQGVYATQTQNLNNTPTDVTDDILGLYVVNPATKVATQIIPTLIDGSYYYNVNPADAAYLYVKSAGAIDECYLDVHATNAETSQTFDGTVKIHMAPVVTTISPTLAVTAVNDDFGTVTGVVAKNGQTNDTTPMVRGTITLPALGEGQKLPGAADETPLVGDYHIAIYDGATYLGLATIGNTDVMPGVRTWEFQSSDIGSDGTHNFVARIVVGNDTSDFVTYYATSAYTVTLDTAISIPEINPTDGKIITGTAEAGVTVTVKNEAGTTTLGTAVADANGKWSLTLATQLTDSSTIKAMATDAAGNASGYSEVETVVYNTPTTFCTITSVTDNVGVIGEAALTTPVKLTSSVNTYTNDNTPMLSGTLSSALLAGESVRIFNGENLVGTATVSGTTWTFTPTALIDASYSLVAQVYNGSKYGKASSAFEFNVDTGIPAQTLTLTSVTDDVAGITGTFTVNATTNDSKPTFTGHLDTALASNESVVAYYIDANGKSVRMGVATMDENDTTGTFTPSTALPDGLNRVYFQVEDAAGNTSAKTDNFVFTVDTIAPSAPTIDTTQTHVSSIEETGGIVCTMTKPENTTLSIDSTTVDGTLFTIDQEGVVHAVGLDFESKSSYTFTVLATDSVGNSSKKSIIVTATNVEEADAIISITPDSLEAVASPAAGETVELTFSVYRSDDLGAAELAWSVTGGLSASDFADGVLPSGTVTFEEGELSRIITVAVPASLTLEAIREVEVTIDTDSNGYRVDLANSTAVIDVVDNATV